MHSQMPTARRKARRTARRCGQIALSSPSRFRVKTRLPTVRISKGKRSDGNADMGVADRYDRIDGRFDQRERAIGAIRELRRVRRLHPAIARTRGPGHKGRQVDAGDDENPAPDHGPDGTGNLQLPERIVIASLSYGDPAGPAGDEIG